MSDRDMSGGQALGQVQKGQAGRARLVAQQGADALDGVEVVPLADRPDRAAVGERLAAGEIEPGVVRLHPRAVERARAAVAAEPSAGGTLPGGAVRAVLEEKELDAAVGGRLQRLRPARGGAAVAPGLLLPALERLGLLLGAPALKHRLDHSQERCCVGMCLGRRPADDRLLPLVRELLLQLRARLVRGDHDHAGTTEAPYLAIEPVGDIAQVLLDELLDVPLVARLRPAALVVTARLLLEMLLELLQPTGPQTVQIAALAPDEGDDRAFATPHEGHERREVERPPDLDRVPHRLAQGQVVPDVVETGAKDRVAARALAAELLREEPAEPLDIPPQPFPLLVRQLRPAGSVGAVDLVEQGVRAAGGVPGGGRDAGVEIEVEADRAALLRPQPCEVAQAVPRDARGHDLPSNYRESGDSSHTLGSGRHEVKRFERSVQTDARAEPARPEDGAASGASGRAGTHDRTRDAPGGGARRVPRGRGRCHAPGRAPLPGFAPEPAVRAGGTRGDALDALPPAADLRSARRSRARGRAPDPPSPLRSAPTPRRGRNPRRKPVSLRRLGGLGSFDRRASFNRACLGPDGPEVFGGLSD